jgi:cytochrome c oxidase subunit 1
MIPSERKIATAMLFTLGCLGLSLLGSLAEILLLVFPADLAIHDSYFLVARMPYVLYTSGLMAVFAAIYYLFPKVFGRSMNETLGKIHFAPTFVAANCTFFLAVMIKAALQPRRCAYATDSGFEWLTPLHGLYQFLSISALALAAVQLIFLANCCYSLFWGPNARHLGERVP